MKVSTAIRRAPTMIRSALRDLRHGRPLGGTARTRYGHLGAFHSTNSPYDELDLLFAGVDVVPDDVIVDVGCGKGRSLNWLLERYPANRIYGIELDPEICARTARRLRRRKNVTIVCGDASELVPPEGTLFYLFNPFDGAVMARFATTLLRRRADGGAKIVYYNAKYLDPFRSDPRFSIRELEDPGLTHRSAVVTLG
jgi:SAM-dependent methyltransferase